MDLVLGFFPGEPGTSFLRNEVPLFLTCDRHRYYARRYTNVAFLSGHSVRPERPEGEYGEQGMSFGLVLRGVEALIIQPVGPA